ncbi:glycosyltransferase family 4 protein [Candidatus Microgenomates bacterium]|nr:glycosyltransferase family 4 protein [Candidatus Microgenomates bacterium]
MSDIKNLFPKVAIVTDQMSSLGGADKEMFSVLKLIPYADIFTITFDSSKYPPIQQKVHTSNVQKLSKILPKNFYRHLKIFTPFVYERFDLTGYDLVISISAGPAKGIITGVYQPHIAMVMTPPRSLWDKELNIRGSKLRSIYKPVSEILNTYMRVWDISISKRVDYWIANSNFISQKIKKIYGKQSQTIYPGIDEKYFLKPDQFLIEKVKAKYKIPEEFFLVVSRLYDYKRVDWAIKACRKANKNLVIVGDGPDRKYLEKIASNDERITFLGFVKKDEEIQTLYSLSQALLFCGIEDFGLVPVEAMASGTPVLAYEFGGVLETVLPGITGEFFKTTKSLSSLLINFDKNRYNKKYIVKQARNFSEEKFLLNLEKYLRKVYEDQTTRKNV